MSARRRSPVDTVAYRRTAGPPLAMIRGRLSTRICGQGRLSSHRLDTTMQMQ